MKRKLIVLAMAAALCSGALLAGCGEEPTPQTSGTASVSSSADTPSSSTPQDSSTLSSVPEANIPTKGDLGKYSIEVLGVKIVKNSDNEDVAIIQMNFTNVSNEEASDFASSVATQVYQDGVQLDTTSANRDDYDFDSYFRNIKQGASTSVDYCIKLSNTTSPLEIDFTEAFTINGKKFSTKLELPKE